MQCAPCRTCITEGLTAGLGAVDESDVDFAVGAESVVDRAILNELKQLLLLLGFKPGILNAYGCRNRRPARRSVFEDVCVRVDGNFTTADPFRNFFT
jgi:hypothetical protein